MSGDQLDDVELRIRLVPGVFTVGIERMAGADRVTLTVLVEEEADLRSVEQEVLLLIAPLDDVGVVIRQSTGSMASGSALERLLIEEGRALRCTAHPGQGSTVRELTVTVRTLADIERIMDLVSTVLGEEFRRQHVHVELEATLLPEEPPRGPP